MPQRKITLSPDELEYNRMITEAINKKRPSDTVKITVGGDVIPVPRPAIFRRDPVVVGRPQEAREVNRILGMNPELRGYVPNVTFGPSPDFQERLWQDNKKFNSYWEPEDFDRLSLLGLTSLKDNSITMNPGHLPRYGVEELRDTLGHEFGHAVGYDEDNAEKLGNLYSNRMSKPKPDKVDFDNIIEEIKRRLDEKGIKYNAY